MQSLEPLLQNSFVALVAQVWAAALRLGLIHLKNTLRPHSVIVSAPELTPRFFLCHILSF